MQKNPMDFGDLEHAEIYMLDVSTGLPCSSYILQQDIRNILNIPEKYVVVRGENEPIELAGKEMVQNLELDQEAKKAGMTKAALLSTDSEYSDAEKTADGSNYYGDSYNNRLLAYLKSIQDENQPLKIDAPAPLFAWLDMPKDSEPSQPPENFNAAINAPKVNDLDPKAKKPAPTGNFDNETDTVKHTYKTKTGKSMTKTATSNNIRKV